jgi:hypothetical protein
MEMTEWNKYPETYPTEDGHVLVLINKEILIAKVFESAYIGYSPIDEIFFLVDFVYTNSEIPNCIKKVARGGSWHKPPLYAEVTHWMKLPELPND